MDLFINDVLQGTLAENLTQPLYFCIDFGWPGQVGKSQPRADVMCARCDVTGIGQNG